MDNRQINVLLLCTSKQHTYSSCDTGTMLMCADGHQRVGSRYTNLELQVQLPTFMYL